MTLGEIIKEIDNGNRIVVHCDTEKKAVSFLTMCKEKGYKWGGDGDELIGKTDDFNGLWDVYQCNTVYFINDPKKAIFLMQISNIAKKKK